MYLHSVLLREITCPSAAGHEVEKIRLAEKNVGCRGGRHACRKLNKRVRNDDANELVEEMLSADVIVLTNPVYFYSMDARLKALIDRSVSRWNDFGRFKGTEFWHIITAADENRDVMSATLEGLRGFMRDCMEGAVECGVFAGPEPAKTAKSARFRSSGMPTKPAAPAE